MKIFGLDSSRKARDLRLAKRGHLIEIRRFQGAEYNRMVSDWVHSSTTLDAEIKSSLSALRARSRQLHRDNDYVKAALREIVNSVVGLGFTFQYRSKLQRGAKMNKALNTQVEEAWKRWTRKDSCDAAGKLSFSEMERLGMLTIAQDGEHYVRMIKGQRFGRSKVPFALQLIPAEQLDENLNMLTPSGNTVRMGVELDKYQRPIAYYFLPAAPGDVIQPLEARKNEHLRVPASEIIPLFVPQGVNQNRGIPWLHATIMRLRHVSGYEEAEVIAARTSACDMGFIESPETETSLNDGKFQGQSVVEFEPGTVRKLLPGEKFTKSSSTRPGNQFEPFMRQMLRGVAMGIGATYEAISGDFSQSNYSSSRLSELKARDQYRAIQKWLAESFHQIVFENWLSMAVLAGEVKIPGYEQNDEAYKSAARWQPRGFGYVDPEKEVNAYKTAVRAGFMTVSEVIAQTGGDFEDVLEEREHELKLADEAGVMLDTDPRSTSNAGLTQARPAGSVLPDPELEAGDIPSPAPTAPPKKEE